MFENTADSPASGVSMQTQSTDCSRARFWVRLRLFSERNAYPGTLRRDQSESAWEVQRRTRKSPLRCLAARSNPLNWEALKKKSKSASVSPAYGDNNVIQQSQKRNVPDLHLFSGVYRLWKKMKNVISDWMYTSTT